ncbi:fungal-specific transcription factor domain-containing protein [Crepidotus variabilis]|uniref:Fungal-specific transcription factor domain-containing protein n=1 Tax=Crepidotus variabilis TaxID=179855 RepID=A0A9P6E6Q6_9AGAR|nr:fungal-specific transcription factor domain-containing protein [Crepidotus variabilis]
MLPVQHNHHQQQPQSLQSALQMDQNHHLIQQHQDQHEQQGGPPGQPPAQGSQPPASKRRKRADGTGEEASSPAEPRRLRRSHEACARCRSKKIKCDSKHPRCTACTTAGTECNQEDRHRQTLTPRGYTERLEHQLAQCEALIKRQIPGFSRDSLDEILAREGIDVGPLGPSPAFPAMDPSRAFGSKPGAYPPMYPPPMMGPYPPPMMPGPYGPHYHQIPMHGPPGAYPMHPPPFPPQPYPHPPPVMHAHAPEGAHPPPPISAPPPTAADATSAGPQLTKGTDPHGHDMSSAQALAKAFGVSDVITSGLKLDPVHEVIPVNPNALPKIEIANPRDASQWITVSIRREPYNTEGAPNTLSLYGPVTKSPHVEVWLPKDRKFGKYIVEGYFARLNIHRPVYARKDFDKIFNDLYDGTGHVLDPGHLCSVYLILALGTLSELNHRAVNANLDAEKDQFLGSSVAKKLMPHEWPTHTEFFERALGVKPDLRVSITSLQALILLHWLLYTERQGRTLWRLTGTLVRLSVELGLHHDPTTQFVPDTTQPLFTPEEAQQRIRLWACVLIHDRGTSILLGRPLAISTSDTNTPHPLRAKNFHFAQFSEHFELSQPVADIQADIINSLYAPARQATDTIWRNAKRIIKRMTEFRRSLPEKYHYYFTGTHDWSMDKKVQLVAGITEDEGLTLLKIGIARILMLRALFSFKDLGYAQKHKALIDAIITAHNVIIIHNQLIRFPDIGFFTSPIPLHIAAMVILYGHMSKVECLPPAIALEDVWMALDMIPRFRWRWERKDANGGHPLIAKLVEHVMGVNLQAVKPSNPHSPPVLIPEPDWEEPTSPSLKSQHNTPIISGAGGPYGPNSPMYGPHLPNGSSAGASAMARSNSGGSTPPDKNLADVPQALFYPFFPENGVPTNLPNAGLPGTSDGPGKGRQDYKELLMAVAAAQDGYGANEGFLSEEKDPGLAPQQQTQGGWVSVPGSRPMHSYTP